jgi:hypothetical protein
MAAVRPMPLPDVALLCAYRDRGAYTDCYGLDVEGTIMQADYIRAFYTSPLFKVERFILKWAVDKPSTDADVAALAEGESNIFAAWTIEERTADQIMLCDFQSRTRSWLMILPLGGGAKTRLYFGTAVVPLRPNGKKDSAFSFGFRLLVPVHQLYARALVQAAARQIASKPAA